MHKINNNNDIFKLSQATKEFFKASSLILKRNLSHAETWKYLPGNLFLRSLKDVDSLHAKLSGECSTYKNTTFLMKTFKGVRQRIPVQQRFAGISSLHRVVFWTLPLVYVILELVKLICFFTLNVSLLIKFRFDSYSGKLLILVPHSGEKI